MQLIENKPLEKIERITLNQYKNMYMYRSLSSIEMT